MRRWLLPLCLLGMAVSAIASGAVEGPASRAPDGYDGLEGELHAGAERLRSALRERLPGLRMVDVEAGYLAGQGVLVLIDVASPWFRIDHGDIDIDPVVTSLEEIPDMVHQILSELDIGLSPQQTEELYELRGLRDGQRAVRAEQRTLRARIREQRRIRLRVESPEEVAALDREIAALDARLEAMREQERALEHQADTMRDTLDAPVARRPEPPPGPSSIDRAVAASVCGHGRVFASLGDDERLNVLVRERRETRYLVFTMSEVRACRDDGDRLLEQAYRYSTSTRSR